MKDGTLERIAEHVRHAREKHPAWRKNTLYAKSVAALEWNEWEHAVEWENRSRAEEEALDLIAVLVRFIERDDL